MVGLTQPRMVEPTASVLGTRTVPLLSHGCRSVSLSTNRFGGRTPRTGWSSISTPDSVVRPSAPLPASDPVVSHQVRCTAPESSVEAEDADPDSTLNLYRKALGLRGQLQSEEHLEWLETGRDDVLAFRRPNGWTNVTVFGDEPYGLPSGELLLASAPVADGALSGVGTAWLRS